MPVKLSVPGRSCMAIWNLLNVPGEEECNEDFDAECFMYEDQEQDDGSDTYLQETEPTGHALQSLKVQLQTLALAKRIICSSNDSDYSELTVLTRAQSYIRLEVSSRALQTTLHDLIN